MTTHPHPGTVRGVMSTTSAVLILLLAAALVMLALTAAPGDHGVPEQHPATAEP